METIMQIVQAALSIKGLLGAVDQGFFARLILAISEAGGGLEQAMSWVNRLAPAP